MTRPNQSSYIFDDDVSRHVLAIVSQAWPNGELHNVIPPIRHLVATQNGAAHLLRLGIGMEVRGEHILGDGGQTVLGRPSHPRHWRQALDVSCPGRTRCGDVLHDGMHKRDWLDGRLRAEEDDCRTVSDVEPLLADMVSAADQVTYHIERRAGCW